jgi:hypothetical protein
MPFRVVLYFGYGISYISGTKQTFYIEKVFRCSWWFYQSQLITNIETLRCIYLTTHSLAVTAQNNYRIMNRTALGRHRSQQACNNEQDSIRKAPVTTGLQFDATYWPLPAVTQVSSSAQSSYQKPNPEPPKFYVLSA